MSDQSTSQNQNFQADKTNTYKENDHVTINSYKNYSSSRYGQILSKKGK